MVWFWLPIWIKWKSCDLFFKVWIFILCHYYCVFFCGFGVARGIVIVRGVSIVWVWFLSIWKKRKSSDPFGKMKKNEKAVVFVIKIEFWSWFWFFFFWEWLLQVKNGADFATWYFTCYDLWSGSAWKWRWRQLFH